MKKILLLLSLTLLVSSCAVFGSKEMDLGQIFISAPDATANLSDRNKALRRLNSAYQAIIINAVSFEIAAMETSQAPSAKRGGRMGWVQIEDKDMPPTFIEAASRLEVGEISKIVKSQYGYHIIKCYARR